MMIRPIVMGIILSLGLGTLAYGQVEKEGKEKKGTKISRTQPFLAIQKVLKIVESKENAGFRALVQLQSKSKTPRYALIASEKGSDLLRTLRQYSKRKLDIETLLLTAVVQKGGSTYETTESTQSILWSTGEPPGTWEDPRSTRDILYLEPTVQRNVWGIPHWEGGIYRTRANRFDQYFITLSIDPANTYGLVSRDRYANGVEVRNHPVHHTPGFEYVGGWNVTYWLPSTDGSRPRYGRAIFGGFCYEDRSRRIPAAWANGAYTSEQRTLLFYTAPIDQRYWNAPEYLEVFMVFPTDSAYSINARNFLDPDVPVGQPYPWDRSITFLNQDSYRP